ncbi:MAG: PHP domain-containing protein [Clostridia bacterium]|nr:PHP domain-containing protein [Clostridia bacterium]
MSRYYYDLHVHSCLSPCGDDDNTPNNICGMASLAGLNIVALTDHNTCKNCPAFFKAARKYGIIAIAGMELTTSEDIHVVCLFERLEDAMRFDGHIESRRMKIKNRKDILGNQLILDGDDNVIGEEEFFLCAATDISVSDAAALVKEYGGVCYPAHIDRDANGIVAVLGDIPPDTDFLLYELHFNESIEEYSKRFSIPKESFIISSDAHCLTDIRDKENYFNIIDEPYSSDLIRSRLFEMLRKGSL